ncbi:agmatine deiminase family protein [Pontibacter sp. HSC-36F09]|uniref:agmatine deiminase family protein n=1 Tax=Pontibacter sp. HSC-36F09 TaxID=2910966 RepID=UPI00209DE424|nr:agmatine deiminase family protein [Pontibacter sp. HSC-36F09]MCP2044413.1 agmatine deiminase [Pontibacter sp. HSC-36F09]
MITDRDTNFVYFSNLIKERPALYEFWLYLEKALERAGIGYGFIENTSDIWCRDYMPVQVTKDKFVQFKYYPSYCDNDEYRHTITDTSQVQLKSLLAGSKLQHPLVLDGGNVVRSGNAVILTERIFSENKKLAKEDVIAQLQHALQVEELYLIPEQPDDMTGHSDGMVRFLDDHTLLVADYEKHSKSWKARYERTLRRTGLQLVKFPNVLSEERDDDGEYTAIGCYINFAWIGKVILFPQFDIPEDAEALQTARSIFSDYEVIPIPARELAIDGGVLNCVTWNVQV